MDFDGPLPPATPNFAISTEFWKRPKNANELIELVRWASRKTVPVSVEAPGGVVANCTSQPVNRRVLLHLVNYNAAKTPKVQYVDVRLMLPHEATAPKVTLYAPGQSDGRPLQIQIHSSVVSFSAPNLDTYALLVVQW